MAKDQFVDRDFVRKVSLEAGLMHPHDLEAVDAIYPKFFAETVEAVSARFAGRAVPSGKAEEVRRHLAALVIAELWKKRGAVDRDTNDRINDARNAALAWLGQSQSITEARASNRPPSGLPGEGGGGT